MDPWFRLRQARKHDDGEILELIKTLKRENPRLLRHFRHEVCYIQNRAWISFDWLTLCQSSRIDRARIASRSRQRTAQAMADGRRHLACRILEIEVQQWPETRRNTRLQGKLATAGKECVAQWSGNRGILRVAVEDLGFSGLALD
jgi:hypothetical protein